MMNRAEQQMKDFVRGGMSLFWQRQAMYFGAASLSGVYFHIKIALLSLVVCEIAEMFELYVSRQILDWNGKGFATRRHLLNLLTISSMLSSIAVIFFVWLVTNQSAGEQHYAPLFFLYSAGLFAAMNNHQIPRVLWVRLAIYGTMFLYVPVRDLWTLRPPLIHELWLQLGVSVFVLYFITNCSRFFLKLYIKGLDQVDELRAERDKAKDAYKVQSQFVSVVSHELRTPLTSIRGALDLMTSGAVGEIPPKIERITKIAHKNSHRLAALIDDLLDIQKLEAGKMEMHMDDINLGVLIKDAADAIDGMANKTGVCIRIEERKQPVFVPGDYDRLMQVLANILSNAVKFSKKGDFIDMSLTKTSDSACISVTDHGSGIPEGAREKVFGRFLQVDSSDQRKIGGTGLGMSITKQIVEQHGGKIDYSSELGVGTTFTVDLKLGEELQEIVAFEAAGIPAHHPVQREAALAQGEK